MTQEYKIVNLDSKSEVFFFAHSFKSAYQHAIDYINRNQSKCRMELFRVNNGVGNRWIKVN